MVSESDYDGADDDFGGILGCQTYLCSVAGCEKVFGRKDRLRHHLSVHEGKKPYVCKHERCSKAYSRPASLKRHVDSRHVTEKNSQVYSCTEEKCDKTFKSLQSLHRHVKRVHNDSLFQCSHCPKSFKKRQQLKIHEYEHTGIKPFKCSIENCSKEFLLPSKLSAHMKYHKGYKCKAEGCELSFLKWSLLRSHVKLDHAEVHMCSTCKRVFSTGSALNSHRIVHGSEWQIFTCPKNGCVRFYFFKKNLNQHLKTTHGCDDGGGGGNNDGDKGLICSRNGCGKKFKHKCSLDRHLKLHETGAFANDKKPKKPRTWRKRRSMAAHLSGHAGTVDEEMAILQPEKFAETKSGSREKIPDVFVFVRESQAATSSGR